MKYNCVIKQMRTFSGNFYSLSVKYWIRRTKKMMNTKNKVLHMHRACFVLMALWLVL